MWPNGYLYRDVITIDHTKVPNTDQTDFPVMLRHLQGTVNTSGTGVAVASGDRFRASLAGRRININGTIYTVDTESDIGGSSVNLTTSAGTQTGVPYSDSCELADTGHGGYLLSCPYDCIYTDASDNLLPFERVAHDAATGEHEHWVKCSLSHTADTVIHRYYGQSSVADVQNPTAVWSSGYVGVYHFGDGSSVDLHDSTGLNATGTNHGTTATSGPFGGGAISADSSYSQYVNLGPVAGFSDLTVQAWGNRTTYNNTSGNLVNKVSATGGYKLFGAGAFFNAGIEIFDATGAGAQACSNFTLAVGTWGCIIGTYTLGFVKFYWDCSLIATNTTPVVLASGTANTTLEQADSGGQWFNGIIDEVRISSVARSADWIAAEYNNQQTVSSFMSLSTPATGSAVRRPRSFGYFQGV